MIGFAIHTSWLKVNYFAVQSCSESEADEVLFFCISWWFSCDYFYTQFMFNSVLSSHFLPPLCRNPVSSSYLYYMYLTTHCCTPHKTLSVIESLPFGLFPGTRILKLDILSDSLDYLYMYVLHACLPLMAGHPVGHHYCLFSLVTFWSH